MQTIFTLINDEKNNLKKHELFEWMSTCERPLSFVPAMTFFVLGFRDVLSYLKRATPKDFWDHTINVHCEEDAHHWLWFIEDMTKIGVKETGWGGDFSKLLKTTWSEENFASRNMIYNLIHNAKNTTDPFVHLALIESLEAAFAVFINTLMPQIEKRNWQNTLRYFGSRHHDDEANHALGTWVGETSIDHDLAAVKLTSEQTLQANRIINETFLNFDQVFKSWYAQKDQFQGRFSPILEDLNQAHLSN